MPGSAGVGGPVGGWLRCAAPEPEWAGESGMAECGQCVAGLAVPEVVEERVYWGRFCVRGQARSRPMYRQDR